MHIINKKANTSKILEPYTDDEIKRLWDNVDLGVPFEDGEIYPVDTILISIYTGMSPIELLELENENINLEDRYITIVNGKTGERTIPIHDDIYPLIKKRKDEGGKYFIFIKDRTDKPRIKQQYRQCYFMPVIERLGLYHSIHDSRHTFILKEHLITGRTIV